VGCVDGGLIRVRRAGGTPAVQPARGQRSGGRRSGGRRSGTSAIGQRGLYLLLPRASRAGNGRRPLPLFRSQYLVSAAVVDARHERDHGAVAADDLKAE
jgi:hypothetical protein